MSKSVHTVPAPARAFVAAAVAAVLLGPTAALSAEQADDESEDEDEVELEEVQVTGSRILRRDLESNSPTVTLEAEVFDNSSNIAVENALNELPQFVPGLVYSSDMNRREQLGTPSNQFFSMSGGTSAAANSFGTIGAGNTVGATTVSLRGLGSNRNLVLMNGKRLVPVNASMGVDTSSIPASALQRVEVVTGGASSVYGADAVSGVINFILRENFQGATMDFQYGISELGDNRNMRISGIVGGNFADGRGNAFLGLEYADRGEALQVERKFYRDQFAEPYGGGGFNQSLLEIRSAVSPVALPAVSTPFGPFPPSFGPSQGVIDSIFAASAPGSVPATSTFVVNPDGTLFVPGDSDGVYKFNAAPLDGLRYKINQQNNTLVENNLLTRISSPLERYSVFSSAHFDMKPGQRWYMQGMFAQSETNSVFNAGLASGSFGVLIPHGTGRNCTSVGVSTGGCENTDPLPANLASYGTWANVPTLALYQAGGAAGLSCSATGGCTNDQAFPLPGGASGEIARVLDSRSTTLFGAPYTGGPGPNADFAVNLPMNMFSDTRSTLNESSNFQLITGFKGDLPLRDWTYDVYGSFGSSRTSQTLKNAVSYSVLRALARQPNYGRGAVIEGNSSNLGSSTQTRPTARCTSGLPVFATQFAGSISQDCINSVFVEPVSTTKMDQTVVEGSIQGGLFELPAGALRFALGSSWRKNSFQFTPADLLSQASVFDGVVGTQVISANRSSDTVKDYFAEMLVPLLKDLPLAHQVDLELGYRYSDYRYAGTVSTWKALADWAITSNIRLRGGYQRANRAPNLVELFEDRTSAVNGPGDPCATDSTQEWSANPNPATRFPLVASDARHTAEETASVRALCEILMGPAGAAAFYANESNSNRPMFVNFISSDSVQIIGNTNLRSEGSDTWTAGLVVRSPSSHPLAQFSSTLDWFKIRVEDSIGNPQLWSLYGGIVRLCLDPRFNTTRDPNNIFCQQVPRDPTTGEKVAGAILPYTNTGQVVSEGVDFSLNWSAALADFGARRIPGRISAGATANYMIRDARQTAPGEPFEDFTGASGFGSFQWSYNTNFGYSNGGFNTQLRWRHYPSLPSYFRSVDPTSPVEGVDTYDIVDVSMGYSFSAALSARFGVDNVFDKKPPIDGYNPGTGGPGTTNYAPGTRAGGVYDVIGRSYYMGLRLSL